MSASQIPNLNSLRASRPVRGRGRGSGSDRPATGGHEDDDLTKDRIVQHTDQDASVSRMSAVESGYLDDVFAKDFIVEATQRRFPIINRGTFVRTHAIDDLVNRFLTSDDRQTKQIISLGAGSDTRFFRLASVAGRCPIVYHELDFARNTAQKISSIRRSSRLMSMIDGSRLTEESNTVSISEDGTCLYSREYNVHAIDLRSLPNLPTSPEPLPNLQSNLPTLLISECCLIYLPPSDADAILKYFTTAVFPSHTPLGIIVYEPINPNDAFGRVMVQNLATRGIVLQTLKKYGSLERQRARLKMLGFSTRQEAGDVEFLWEHWISREEKERVAQLEMLDEVEEWKMLAQHYCVAFGWRNGSSVDGHLPTFSAWEELNASSVEDWKHRPIESP